MAFNAVSVRTMNRPTFYMAALQKKNDQLQKENEQLKREHSACTQRLLKLEQALAEIAKLKSGSGECARAWSIARKALYS